MSKNLNNTFDVLIVGGGVIGMLTARNLQRDGLHVALVDKGKLGNAATWAAGGILSALNPWQQNESIQPLIKEGQHIFSALARELKQETSIDPEYIRCGMLALDVSQKEQALNWARQENQTITLLSGHSLSRLEPKLTKHLPQALFLPDIAQVRPPKLIAALHKSLQQLNVRLFENSTVSKLLFKTNKVIGANTTNGKLFANKIILASGAWTKSILEKNTSNIEKIDIEPVRGQMLLYKTHKKLLSHIVLKEKTYLIPRQDGHILCGSTLEHVGFENQTTDQARIQLEEIAHGLLPELKKYEPIKQWSALRPGTNRNRPYICQHPDIDGLYLNSGHYRYGIVMSIASARIMAELVANSMNSSQTPILA